MASSGKSYYIYIYAALSGTAVPKEDTASGNETRLDALCPHMRERKTNNSFRSVNSTISIKTFITDSLRELLGQLLEPRCRCRQQLYNDDDAADDDDEHDEYMSGAD